MDSILFYLFALVMIAFGFGVVMNRNPVTSAMCLVGCFLGVAALFIMLDAFFIGVVQIAVYAGAVIVLFVFILMLLDIAGEKRREFPIHAIAIGLIVAVIVGGQIAMVAGSLDDVGGKFPPIDKAAAVEARVERGNNPDSTINTILTDPKKPSYPDVHIIGEALFTRYPLHLQIVAVLLTVGAVGVVVLSKKRLE